MSRFAFRDLSPSRLMLASIVVAGLTIAIKTAAWYVTGSVGLLSDAMESLVNLASAIFGLLMVTIAERPADDDHPYGHHKAEYFSSGFEGALIMVAAVAIIWASVHRALNPQPLEQLGWGLALSVFSSALNGLLAWVMFAAARQHRSIALEADAKHLLTDVWTSVGVVVGIGAVMLTGWLWLDAVVAIGVAFNILWQGGQLVWRSSQGLMDEAIEPEALAQVHAALEAFSARAIRIDHLITRSSGQRRYVDLHLHVPASWTLGRAAQLRAELEQALIDAVPDIKPTIQLLPADVEPLQGDDVDLSQAAPPPQSLP